MPEISARCRESGEVGGSNTRSHFLRGAAVSHRHHEEAAVDMPKAAVAVAKRAALSEGVKSAPRFSVGLERFENFNYCAAESGNVLL